MPDMLVKLYELPPLGPILEVMASQAVTIRRAMAPDKMRIVQWVQTHSSAAASGEADVCFSHTPISLFVATREKEILGYACYNATAPDFFGPTRVLDGEQGKQIGKALLLRSLHALQDEGYAYAIIGGVGPRQFYEKCVGATLIEGSKPGIYKDFLGARS
jgi:hypothetical protein